MDLLQAIRKILDTGPPPSVDILTEIYKLLTTTTPTGVPTLHHVHPSLASVTPLPHLQVSDGVFTCELIGGTTHRIIVS